jgi:LysM repeat protein
LNILYPSMMRFFLVSILFIALNSIASGRSIPVDSIGIEKVDGQIFILHQVEEKETLYSLSKRYDVSISAITTVNATAENGLTIGQILRIPVPGKHPMEDGRIKHIVQPKETLYSIARAYKISVEDIKEWNKMSMNILDIGQELIIYPEGKKEISANVPERVSEQKITETRHVVKAKETLYSIAQKYGTSLENLRNWNNLEYNDISIGQELIVSRKSQVVTPPTVTTPVTSPKESTPSVEPVATVDTASTLPTVSTSETVVYTTVEDKPLDRENTNFEEVEEDGQAELIEGSSNNRKYLALHRTAPIGTIMRVRNDMNGQEVFVRIIGKLPDTGSNRNVLIKISRAAYEQLGAIDNRFRVKIAYIP